MPAQDDERFESYLKQFRPITADALPVKHQQHRTGLRLWVIGFAATIVAGVVAFQVIHRQAVQNPKDIARVGNAAPPVQPLTLRNANALLANAPTYKAAVNSIAFRTQNSEIPKDKQSALAVLSKEKIKL